MRVGGATIAHSAARWYFGGSQVEKRVDEPFPLQPGLPSCGYREGVTPICSNCANAGLGASCRYDGGRFHGLYDGD